MSKLFDLHPQMFHTLESILCHLYGQTFLNRQSITVD